MKETLISDTQYQKEVIEKSVNVYDSHFQSDKPVITKVTKTSSKKHTVPLNSDVQITIEEDNKDLIPSNDVPVSKPGMSISIDSGNSEPSDLISSSSSSSSSAAAAPAGTHYKADTPSCNSGSSSQVFEVGSENSSPTPSAGVLIESSKLSNWSSSSEKISQRNNKTQDEELHDDSISEQMKDDGLSKKADKKKQNTHLDKIPDDPILSQSTDLIGQALIQSNISSTIIHDSDILPDEVQQASELLIDPQKIKSMHKTPQELTDESILTIVSSKLPDTEVSSTQLSSQASKNESKKSKKKHEKISHEVGKPLEVTTGNFNHIMLTSTNTTPSDEQAKLMELDISSCQVASELSDINRSHLTTVDISLNGTTITIPKKSPCKQSKMKSMSTSLNDEKLTNEIHINLPNSSFITEKVQLSSIIPLSNYNSDKSTRNETQFIQSSLQVLNDERQEQSRHIIDNLLFNNTELNNIPSNNNNRPIVNSKKKQKETTKPIKDRIDDFKKDKVVKEHLSPDVSLRTLINKTESSLLLASSSNKSINQASQNFNKQESNKKNKKNKLSLCNDDDNFISLESSVLNIMKTHQSSINPQQENKISNKIIYPQMNQKCSTSKKKLSLPKLKKIKNKNKLNSIDQTHQYVMNESIMEQSKIINTDMKESQENLRKRRFPKSFMTQVDPKYNRSVRIAAKRRKVNSDEKQMNHHHHNQQNRESELLNEDIIEC
ncbi:unnamed protein product [Heterobilharzia americana]|nr:unnamed protein product [Heterobilharzia americana]